MTNEDAEVLGDEQQGKARRSVSLEGQVRGGLLSDSTREGPPAGATETKGCSDNQSHAELGQESDEGHSPLSFCLPVTLLSFPGA